MRTEYDQGMEHAFKCKSNLIENSRSRVAGECILVYRKLIGETRVCGRFARVVVALNRRQTGYDG